MNRPRLLLLALDNWYGSARLPKALQAAGFFVGVMAEPDSFISTSRFVDCHLAVSVKQIRNGGWSAAAAALVAFGADLILPADERAVRFLHFLTRNTAAANMPVLRRSLGDLSTLAVRGDRDLIMKLAGAIGVSGTRHSLVATAQAAIAFADDAGWPVFLKRDGTYAGQGVRRCADEETLTQAFVDLSGDRPGLHTWRSAWARGKHMVRTMLSGPDPLMNRGDDPSCIVEAEVVGQPAFFTGVALDGRMLAGVSAAVSMFYPKPAGPSTQLRLHHDREMTDIAARLVEDLGFSGFFGLDFMRTLEGRLLFLEFNQRPTSVAHLGGLVDNDLCAALYAGLSGKPPRVAPADSEAAIALFPQDWLRDSDPGGRIGLYADIPVDDPKLLAAYHARLRRHADVAGSD